jgi:hypothetical protein
MDCLNTWKELIVELREIQHFINVLAFLISFRIMEVDSMMESLILSMVFIVVEFCIQFPLKSLFKSSLLNKFTAGLKDFVV